MCVPEGSIFVHLFDYDLEFYYRGKLCVVYSNKCMMAHTATAKTNAVFVRAEIKKA
jgi:hypothetical protein